MGVVGTTVTRSVSASGVIASDLVPLTPVLAPANSPTPSYFNSIIAAALVSVSRAVASVSGPSLTSSEASDFFLYT